jgi:DNA invertase Pin-like site-specific DNA recombinase
LRALAYVRVSREGEDPGNQLRAIAEWAARSGVEVLSYYIDVDVSGATRPRDRPQYRAMLEAARALGVRLLLFYDLSRLSRSLEEGLLELRQLTEEGFDFRFVAQEFLDYIADPVLRKKVIADFLWFAELYREDVRRRTLEGLRRARAEGRRLGRPPYPFPAEEVRKLLARGYSVAEAHRLLVLEGRLCREVNGRRECMKYETFRRKVKALTARAVSVNKAG